MSTELTKAAAVMGRKGGLARARNLSKEQIAEISRKAGLASAEKRKQVREHGPQLTNKQETHNDNRHGDSANN